MLEKQKEVGYTAEQYLALEEQASYKSECRNGPLGDKLRGRGWWVGDRKLEPFSMMIIEE